MNSFKNIDMLYPILPYRASGEVINVCVTVYLPREVVGPGRVLGVISGKRKAWYVNASTNAFILHRHLCHEFRRLLAREDVSFDRRTYRIATSSLRKMVMDAYIRGITGEQRFDYSVEFQLSGDPVIVQYDGDGIALGENLYLEPEEFVIFPEYELIPYSPT